MTSREGVKFDEFEPPGTIAMIGIEEVGPTEEALGVWEIPGGTISVLTKEKSTITKRVR